MKRIRCFFMAAVLLATMLPLSGCGLTKEDGSTLELSMDHSWRTEQTMQSMSHGPLLSFGSNLLCSKALTTGEGIEFCWYDLETGEKNRLPGTPMQCVETLSPLERLGVNIIRLPDGNIGIYCNIYQNLGGGESEVHRKCMEVFDTQLQYLETREIPTDFAVHPDFNGMDSSTSLSMDGQGNWYAFHHNYYSEESVLEVYNSEYQKYGEIVFPANTVFSPCLFSGADGSMYAAFNFQDGAYAYYQKVYRLDAENRTCVETKVTVPQLCYEYRTGTNGYDYYYMTNDGLYGVKDDECTEVIDWINSDFMPEDILNFFPIEDGSFLLMDENRRWWHAKPRTQEEIDATTLISLAAVEYSEELLNAVIDYNREDSGYRIIVVDYSDYHTAENPDFGYDIMKQDMLDGRVADIVCTDGVNFESLAAKGLFVDWYDLMDADESFDRADYLENFFEACEYDGKLQRLGFSYVIETGTAKTELAGDTQGLSLGQQLDAAQKQGIDAFYYSPAEVLAQSWMSNLQTGCIDRKTLQCYFDSPEFVQFLELLNSIPQGDKFYEAAQNGAYSINEQKPYQNGMIFLNTKSIAQPIDFRAIRRADFFDADITLVGVPMVQDEGNGGVFNVPFTVSVNAQSKEHAAIWDFMKFFLSEDYQKRLTASMPIHEGALEYKLEEAEDMVTANVGGTVFIGEMEEWESDLLRDYIHGIRTCWYYDRKVYDILMEETDKMLAGDQTPQEAAQVMQSRVTIYLSEQS